MEECGAVSLGQGIPFHTLVKKKKKGRRRGKGLGGAGPLSQAFQGWTSCSSGLFSIPRNSRQAEPPQGNAAEQPPD